MNAQAQRVDALSECIDFAEQQVEFFKKYKASARKSYGSYKPIIVSPNGRTEVCGQRRETRYLVWVDGKPDPKTMYVTNHRGLTFTSREEAVQYADRCIGAKVTDAEKRLARFRERAAHRTALTRGPSHG